jgi:hypothetical protein
MGTNQATRSHEPVRTEQEADGIVMPKHGVERDVRTGVFTPRHETLGMALCSPPGYIWREDESFGLRYPPS